MARHLRNGVSRRKRNDPQQEVWDVRPAVTSANGVSAQAQRAQGRYGPRYSNSTGGPGQRVVRNLQSAPDATGEW